MKSKMNIHVNLEQKTLKTPGFRSQCSNKRRAFIRRFTVVKATFQATGERQRGTASA